METETAQTESWRPPCGGACHDGCAAEVFLRETDHSFWGPLTRVMSLNTVCAGRSDKS